MEIEGDHHESSEEEIDPLERSKRKSKKDDDGKGMEPLDGR